MNTVTLLTPQKLVAANNGGTSTGSVQTLELATDKLAVVRTHLTIGGTNTPAFYASVLCLTTPVYV